MMILWVLMWVLLGLLSLLLALAIWLLLAPVAIQINSKENIYRLRWHTLASLQLRPHEEHFLLIELKILFFRWEFDLLNPPKRFRKWFISKKKKKDKKQVKRAKKKSSPNLKKIWRIIKKVMLSFNVVVFEINFDTGNAVWNAWLYPFAMWMNRLDKVRVDINWIEQQELEIDVRNSGWRIARALLF